MNRCMKNISKNIVGDIIECRFEWNQSFLIISRNLAQNISTSVSSNLLELLLIYRLLNVLIEPIDSLN